jgi:hypothetical protein
MKGLISEIRTNPKGWLLLLVFAACLHVATTASIFVVGRASLMPSKFNASGLGEFASDSFFYQGDIVSLNDKLEHQGPLVWLKSVAPLHIKLYSLSHFFFSPWMAPNVLTIEPLNLIYYLVILYLVYQLAERIFDRSTGLLAITLIALWPSFLMHTTQLIRDPLLIVAVLFFILVVASWLTKTTSFRRDLAIVVPAVLAVLTIWIVRLAMWDAVRAIVLMGIVLLFIRHVRERRFFAAHIVNAIILTVAILTIPQSQTVKSQQRREADIGRPLIAERVADLPVTKRMEERRQAFAKLKNVKVSSNASNLDNEIQLNSPGDFIQYLPRAAEIGLFAPFPNMWFAKGSQVGRTGRLISGVETVVTYALEALMFVGLWQKRKNLAAWLLVLTTVSALTALGFIVLNVGSLYRFRYPFLMLIIVLGAGGATFLLRRYAHGNKQLAHELASST